MYTNSKLVKAVRLAIAFGAASAAAVSTNVVAAEEGEEVERIEVTGSRIKRTDLESASPVTVVSRDDMINLGITDVGDLIQRMPAMSGSPIGTTTNNGGSGGVFVNLRGLGSIRTLVLINGRRTVDGGDFQTIPSTMIKEVQILKDGASAVYGADAVAGVVNIITRDDFEGVQFEVQQRDAFDTDGGIEKIASMLAGKAWDGGNVVFGAEYVEQEAVLQGGTDTEFFQNSYFIVDGEGFDNRGFVTADQDPENPTVFGLGSSRNLGGNFNVNGTAASQTLDNSAWGTNFPTADQFRDYVGGGAVNDTYNYAPVNFLQTPYTRANVFMETKFDVAEDVRFFGAIRLNQRESAQRLAPVPFDTQFDPGYSVERFNADGESLGMFNGVSKDNAYNPFGEDIWRARRRIVEGERRFEQDVTQVQAVAGFEGEFNDIWSWDVSYNWGRRSRTDVDYGQLYGQNVANALGPSFVDDDGNVVCGTPDSPIAGCVSLNLFGGPGTITQEMLDYISAPLVDTVQTEQDMITANVVGELFDLPAGTIGVAFGYEYRREALQNEVDSGKYMDTVSGNTGQGTKGSYTVNSLYGEFLVPLLADAPFAEMLDLKLGIRYDDFSTFGSNTTLQSGIEWRPMPGLLVRGTVGEVFRAPNINELFDGQADGFPQTQDPCSTTNWGDLSADGQARCVAQGVPQGGYQQTDSQLRARVGGNTDLAPEEGDTYTVGIAWSPEFLDGFSMTADWWKVELDGVIASLSAQSTLDQCINDGSESACANISRFSDGRINAIFAANRNLASMKAEGVDFTFDYNFEIGEWGEIKTHLGWTHLIDRSRVDSEGQPEIQMAGTHDFDLGEVYAKDKAIFDANWYWNDLSVTYSVEHISDITAEVNFIDYTQEVGSATYQDIAVAYNFDFGTRVSMGINNFADRDPTYIDAGFNGSTDPSTYRIFGREYFVRISHSF